MKALLILISLTTIFSFSSQSAEINYLIDGQQFTVNEKGAVARGEFVEWNETLRWSILIFGAHKGVSVKSLKDSKCINLEKTNFKQFSLYLWRKREIERVTFCPNFISVDSIDAEYAGTVASTRLRIKEEEETYGGSPEDLDAEVIEKLIESLTGYKHPFAY